MCVCCRLPTRNLFSSLCWGVAALILAWRRRYRPPSSTASEFVEFGRTRWCLSHSDIWINAKDTRVWRRDAGTRLTGYLCPLTAKVLHFSTASYGAQSVPSFISLRLKMQKDLLQVHRCVKAHKVLAFAYVISACRCRGYSIAHDAAWEGEEMLAPLILLCNATVLIKKLKKQLAQRTTDFVWIRDQFLTELN